MTGCAFQSYLINRVADSISVQDQSEDDIVLAREASAFYLKFSESILRQTPGNLKLAESVGAGYTQYAYAFVAFEADQVESKDTHAAQLLRQRAAKLYARAHRHAMTALELNQPGFKQALTKKDPQLLHKLSIEQVGVAYWAAASWGGLISLSKDDPDVVADLPLAIELARLAWTKNPEYGQGSLTSLLGTFEASRPSGSLNKAEQLFNQAIAQSRGESAGQWVAKAESIALAKQDRQLFIGCLQQAVVVANKYKNLQNEVMLSRATWLLEKIDDLF